MRTTTKLFVASLGIITLLGTTTASAETRAASAPDGPLGMAIALQGDHALLKVIASSAESIAPAIRQQMASALPRYSSVGESDPAQRANSRAELAVLMPVH